jgi:hypothetical protein
MCCEHVQCSTPGAHTSSFSVSLENCINRLAHSNVQDRVLCPPLETLLIHVHAHSMHGAAGEFELERLHPRRKGTILRLCNTARLHDLRQAPWFSQTG